jgi:predicted transposase/invertase (TIGR01784 family)
MRTVAQKYIDEGKVIGIQLGKAIGEARRNLEVARNLKKAGISIEIISQPTGLTKEQIEELE